MFGIMSYFAFILVILIFFMCPITMQQTLPPKAVNAERIKLLKDALSWMTFRKNGELASDLDLEPFFGVLKDKYLTSKYYKTLIIAFSRGVLPKLTLKENVPCDPAYTLEYKDSHNNSATYGQLKKFIIGSYDKRGEATRQFCDYRQGLVCNQQTSKCECPQGTKMEPISQGSAVSRCLVQENQVCSLIDLDHDPTSNYGALKKHLPEMVLNLEKPVSCQMGTQCRFKSTSNSTPLCHKVNSGPWNKGLWNEIDLGEECTLGLYADTGQCKEATFARSFDGYTCFNFGPRSLPKSPRVGLCAHEMGSYAITTQYSMANHNGNYSISWDFQMIAFVSPATTPLRGTRLFDYYSQYLGKLTNIFLLSNTNSVMVPYAGGRCNIGKTEKMLELWKFFKSLENPPPQGKDYLATEAELQDKFKEAEELTVEINKKICRVSTDLNRNNGVTPALKCVRNFTIAENDGTCQAIPQSEDATWAWANTFLKYREHVASIIFAPRREERDYRKDIFEPEMECDPMLAAPAGSQGAPPSNDSDVLEGGYCSPGRGCYEDYGDYNEIYDENCQLKDVNRKLWRNCQDLDDNRRFQKCEKEQLDKIFVEELGMVTSYAGLERGDECRYNTENNLRSWIGKGGLGIGGNRYKRLTALYKIRNGLRQNKLCDRTKLLGCSQNRTCECLPGTQPREVNLEGSTGTTLYSDYCYVASGDCDRKNTLNFITDKSSQPEKDEIRRHYDARAGEGSQSSCQASNWCVFTLEEPGKQVMCTTQNTGSTGHDGSEPVTTTTVRNNRRTTTDKDESHLMCTGNKCGWQEAGGAQKKIHVVLKMIILIEIIIMIV